MAATTDILTQRLVVLEREVRLYKFFGIAILAVIQLLFHF